MKHQLRHGMYCKIDENIGEIMKHAYKKNIYFGRVCPSDKYLEFDETKDLCARFEPKGGQEVSSKEFFERLKGEYKEPLKLELGKVYEDEDNNRYLVLCKRECNDYVCLKINSCPHYYKPSFYTEYGIGLLNIGIKLKLSENQNHGIALPGDAEKEAFLKSIEIKEPINVNLSDFVFGQRMQKIEILNNFREIFNIGENDE